VVDAREREQDRARGPGWEIAWPSLFLVMGRDREFANNPSQLEEVRSRIVDQGVHMLTTDDILAMATRQVESRIWTPGVTQWVFSSELDLPRGKPHLASIVFDENQEWQAGAAGFVKPDNNPPVDAFFVDTGYIIDLISFRPARDRVHRPEFHAGASLIWHEFMAKKVRQQGVACFYSAFVLQEVIHVISRILFQAWKTNFAQAPELGAAIGKTLAGDPRLSTNAPGAIPSPEFMQTILPFVQSRIAPLLERMTRIPDQPLTLATNLTGGWSMQEFLEIGPFQPADCQLLATVLGNGVHRFVTNDRQFILAGPRLKKRFGLLIVPY
jgi:hypothetical protein